jgi:hypothetical protein
LSTNSRIVLFSRSPLIDVIIYFNRVDNSAEEFLLIFLRPVNSFSIFFSSADVNILKVILVSEYGRVKWNSLTPLVIKDSLNSLLFKVDKSTV